MHQAKNPLEIKDIIPKLNQIVSAVSNAVETGTIEEVLKKIADFNRSLVNARFAAIGVPDSKGQFLTFQISGLADSENLKESIPEGLGLLGLIIEEKRTLLVDAILSDRQSIETSAGPPDMTHLLGVPIHIGNQLLGILYLMDREDGLPFEEQDQLITEIIAGYAALAIAGANLSQQKERIALLEERERIAMELHDGIIQSLYGIGMQVEIARSDGVIDVDEMRDVVKSLDDVINDIRYYIRDLRKADFHQRSLRDFLTEILTRLHIPPSIKLKIEVPQKQSSLSASQMEGIGLIATEAASNAIRHAKASAIIVKAWEEEKRFTLIIEDDGLGFNAAETLKVGKGMGLNNMKHRVSFFNGELKIDSDAQTGTRVTIIIPLT